MKHTSYITYGLLLLVALVSCRRIEPEYVDFAKYKGQANAFVPMREQVSDIRNEQPWENVEPDLQWRTDSVRQPMRTSPLTVTDVARGFLGSMLTYKVRQVAGTYRSIDINGDSLTVSGKFFYPADGIIKNLMIVSHYTIGANFEAPSETFSFEGMYAGMGYGVLCLRISGEEFLALAQTREHDFIDGNRKLLVESIILREVSHGNLLYLLQMLVLICLSLLFLVLTSLSLSFLLLEESNGSARRLHQSEDEADERSLATTVRSDDAQVVIARHGEVDVAEYFLPLVTSVEMFYFDDC